MTWIGPTLLVVGVMTIVVALRTECKNPLIDGYGTWREILLFALGAIAVIVGAALTALSAAQAHETKTGWRYDNACCSEQHCHPVKDGVVTDMADGVWVEGFGIMSYTDQRLRRSGDDEDHLCTSDGKLLCVYQKPKDM